MIIVNKFGGGVILLHGIHRKGASVGNCLSSVRLPKGGLRCKEVTLRG